MFDTKRNGNVPSPSFGYFIALSGVPKKFVLNQILEEVVRESADFFAEDVFEEIWQNSNSQQIVNLDKSVFEVQRPVSQPRQVPISHSIPQPQQISSPSSNNEDYYLVQQRRLQEIVERNQALEIELCKLDEREAQRREEEKSYQEEMSILRRREAEAQQVLVELRIVKERLLQNKMDAQSRLNRSRQMQAQELSEADQ